MFLTMLLAVCVMLVLRTLYLLHFKRIRKLHNTKARTLVVIGSGGHTLEMLKQIRTLSPKLYSPRLYVIANGDVSSEYKIKEIEQIFEEFCCSNSAITKIPRSRRVNQSYLTSIFTTIYSTLMSIPVVANFKPDLILCNGPGTCIPVCLIAYFLNILLFYNIRIVFIESICRVRTLSLSGKILYYIADVLIVQWPYLHEQYPQTVFLGRL